MGQRGTGQRRRAPDGRKRPLPPAGLRGPWSGKRHSVSGSGRTRGTRVWGRGWASLRGNLGRSSGPDGGRPGGWGPGAASGERGRGGRAGGRAAVCRLERSALQEGRGTRRGGQRPPLPEGPRGRPKEGRQGCLCRCGRSRREGGTSQVDTGTGRRRGLRQPRAGPMLSQSSTPPSGLSGGCSVGETPEACLGEAQPPPHGPPDVCPGRLLPALVGSSF